MKIGILGGGQLGRMLALAGVPLGHECVFLDPKEDACAALVGSQILGTCDDPQCLQALADASDLVTYETENLPVGCVDSLQSSVDVFPSLEALRVTQDRLEEKTLCNKLGIPTAQFANVEREDNLESALQEIGLPNILKTRRMGYDGKGQCVLRQESDITKASSLCSQPCILEQMVTFKRELSIIATRSNNGDIVYYPLTENVHKDSILHVSRAPAIVDTETEHAARSIAERLLSHFNYVGTMAIELFHMEDGQLLLNEIAPRVHNSGHWTIEGAETSQFENHVRAICGMPLGSSKPRGYSGMVNIIGTHPAFHELMSIEGVHVHLYNKAERPKRKLGHVTVCDSNPDVVTSRIDSIIDIVNRG